MQQRKLTRLQAVINLIQQKKRISVDDLSKHFNVSLVTIRRDLEELERNGRQESEGQGEVKKVQGIGK